MSVCGWCKRGGLKPIRISRINPDTGKPEVTADTGLERHITPGTAATVCKGPESYRQTEGRR